MCRHVFSYHACGHLEAAQEQCDLASSPFGTLFCERYTSTRIKSAALCGSSGGYCKHTREGQLLESGTQAVAFYRDKVEEADDLIKIVKQDIRLAQVDAETSAPIQQFRQGRKYQPLLTKMTGLQRKRAELVTRMDKLVNCIKQAHKNNAVQDFALRAGTYSGPALSERFVDSQSVVRHPASTRGFMGHQSILAELQQPARVRAAQTSRSISKTPPQPLGPAFETKFESRQSPLTQSFTPRRRAVIHNTGFNQSSARPISAKVPRPMNQPARSPAMSQPSYGHSPTLEVRRSGRLSTKQTITYAESPSNSSRETSPAQVKDADYRADLSRSAGQGGGFIRTQRSSKGSRHDEGSLAKDMGDGSSENSETSILSDAETVSTPSELDDSPTKGKTAKPNESRSYEQQKPSAPVQARKPVVARQIATATTTLDEVSRQAQRIKLDFPQKSLGLSGIGRFLPQAALQYQVSHPPSFDRSWRQRYGERHSAIDIRGGVGSNVAEMRSNVNPLYDSLLNSPRDPDFGAGVINNALGHAQAQSIPNNSAMNNTIQSSWAASNARAPASLNEQRHAGLSQPYQTAIARNPAIEPPAAIMISSDTDSVGQEHELGMGIDSSFDPHMLDFGNPTSY